MMKINIKHFFHMWKIRAEDYSTLKLKMIIYYRIHKLFTTYTVIMIVNVFTSVQKVTKTESFKQWDPECCYSHIQEPNVICWCPTSQDYLFQWIYRSKRKVRLDLVCRQWLNLQYCVAIFVNRKKCFNRMDPNINRTPI